MTTATTTERAGRGRPGPWLRTVRARVLARNALLLGLATLASVLVARQVVVAQIDERIDEVLLQERQELQRLVDDGVDPDTGEPLGGRVRRIFEVFLQRNVPSRGEAYLTFVGGRPYLRSAQVLPYRLDQDERLVEMWSGLQRVSRARVDTPAGEVDYLAVPVRVEGETRGVFVVAQFRAFETRNLDDITLALSLVGALVLALGTLLSWRGTERVIAPVREVTRAAREISETDLGRRIPPAGDEEVAELARTFNGMLDRLEAAFATQRRFLDDAGHELRTPITIVRGHLELMGDEPEERRATLALVLDELERMSRLVEDVITLAKAERPDFLDLRTVDVEGLTREVHAKATGLAPRRWVLQETGRGVVVADRQRLTQAIVQLAQNAVQHTGPDDVIAISSRIADGEATFTVRDTGPGVAPADRERIFDRFGRGRGARREGAGLGLAIVRAIAEAHGGRVAVDGPDGGGAAFRLTIPVDPPREEERGGS